MVLFTLLKILHHVTLLAILLVLFACLGVLLKHCSANTSIQQLGSWMQQIMPPQELHN